MKTFWERAERSVKFVFVVCLGNFSYFPFWFCGQDFSSEFTSSWQVSHYVILYKYFLSKTIESAIPLYISRF